MRLRIHRAFLMSSITVLLLVPTLLFAQRREEKKAPVEACKDEEGMVVEYRTRLAELVEQVRQETLEDFKKAYHQKSCLTMLTLYVGVLEGQLACLEQATKDEAATKQQRESYKAKLESSTALKAKLERYRDDLKAAKTADAAKPLIEKFELTK